MGVDFSHGDFTMSYGGFRVLLEDLASEAGICLVTMHGFGGDRSWDEIDDPLRPLFTTRDQYGGGTVSPYDSLLVKRRIQELATRWSDKRADRPHRHKPHALRLATALSEAAFLGERFQWF
jgi:hypothetical protein